MWENFIKEHRFSQQDIYSFTLAVANEFNYDDFIIAPGAKDYHHNYINGLHKHTESVVLYSSTIAFLGSTPKINTSIIISAAYLHDLGKLFDYKFVNDKIEKTTSSRLLNHICSIQPYLDMHAHLIENANDFIHIKHCILSHHGKLEWGSPVVPATPEAYIVHTADMLSSRLDDYTPDNTKEWQYHLKSFGGPIWNPDFKETCYE